MTDNNLNKKYFTEEDSPVPLIPTDIAWDNMREKLNNEMPDKKKRRFFIWIPPVGCALFALFAVGVISLWLFYHAATSSHSKKKDTIAQIDQSKHSSFSKPDITSNENSIQKEPLYEHKHVVNEQTQPQRITLTANSTTGSMRQSKKQHLKQTPKKRADNESLEDDTENYLKPLSPASTVLSNNTSIAVEAKRSLPVVSTTPSPDSTHKNKLSLSAGLQWQTTVPFTDLKYSLKGPDGKDQLYRVLLPGVWLSANKGKQRVIATFNPFISAPMPDKYYGKASVLFDATRSIVVNKRMVKTFGYQAGLAFTYQFHNHWWVGIGADGNWWKKGLVLAQPGDSLTGMKPFLYSVNAKKEDKMAGFQLSGNIQLSWQHNAWEGVMQISSPFNATIKGAPLPIWFRLGVRCRLLNTPFHRK